VTLALLLGRYLHPDWSRDYASAWNAIDAFRVGENVAPLLAELRELLAREPGEEAACEIMRDSGYWPPGDGYTCVGWLHALDQHLRA